MRVLLISHTCQSQYEGQPKAALLGQIPGLDLRLLVPDRWREYGKWRGAQPALTEDFTYQVGRVCNPWVGPAQTYLHWYPELAQTLREFRPDIIDLWEEPWSFVSAHTAWLRGRLLPQARLIAETEQNIIKTLPPPFEMFRDYTLRHADFVIGRNTEAVSNVKAKGFRGPAAVVPNAVDADLFRPLDRRECRQALGLSGFVVGYIGRYVEEKGLLDMVDALRFCPDDVNLLFVGSGDHQADLLLALERQGLAHRARFLPKRPLADLPQVMNALDVLALPSRTTPRWKEQFGRVIIEAQACGTPVIGSNSGAIPEVIGEGGLVFPERDPAALAAAIMRLRADQDWARSLGSSSRRRVEARYTWPCIAQQMYGIYQEVLTSQSPLPARSVVV